MLAQEAANPFPHRKQCDWIDQGNGLSARVCDDGEVMMYHDFATRDTWLPTERPPKKWKRYFRQMGLHGAAPIQAGICPPHPHAIPNASPTVRRLQTALQGLAQRMGDKMLHVAADGIVGPHTVKAANRAMLAYAKGGAPDEFTTGALTRGQVLSFAPQLTAYVQRSPFIAASMPATAPEPTAPASPAAAPEGASPMPPYYTPGYAPAPAYYPGYPQRGPGGLPTDRATVDVRAFLPAQYEHVSINPTTVMAVLAVGVVVVLVMDRKKKGS